MRSVFATMVLTMCLAGCAGQAPGPGPRAPAQDSGASEAAPAVGQWLEILPGGNTLCSRGTPYRFFIRGGRTDRVLIDFEGGGACWNALTCAASGSLFFEQARTLSEFRADLDSGRLGGIYSDEAESPFADWTLVHIPYCTGDIHWGDAVQSYAEGGAIQHRGFVNASSALDWVYAHYASPEHLFVTGCSAGAYGAALHSAYIARHYPGAKLAVLADSGAGVITDSFLQDSLPNWNAERALPKFIEALNRPIAELRLPDVYKALSIAYPQHRYAQTATQYDADQIFFYTAMGGKAADWPGKFRASLDEIESSAPNFRAYVPPGSMHCALPYPFFHTREVNGVKLAKWTEQLVLGAEPPDDVICEGAQCCDDAVCDACAGDMTSPCKFCQSWPPSWSECAR